MKSLFQNLFAKLVKHPVRTDPGAPPYVYPNDDDATLEEAVQSLWEWYVELGRRMQISVQGMGGTVEQYNIKEATFKDGLLSWQDAEDPDCVEIHSEEHFRQSFLGWAGKRVKPFSDTGEYALAVYALDDVGLRGG